MAINLKELWYGRKKKPVKRVRITKTERELLLEKQSGKCWECKTKLIVGGEIHHKDGNPANWKLSNLALICRNCHEKKTRKQRYMKIVRKRKEKEKHHVDPITGFCSTCGKFHTKVRW